MANALKTILIPVDGSAGAAHAVRFGAQLARDTGADLTFVHVYDTTVISMMGFKALSGKEIDDAVQRVSSGFFEAARVVVGADPPPIKQRVLIGNPAREIVALAEELHVDLIVMGSRGQSDFKNLVVGSVSTQVVQHAPCPVTVVR